MFKDSIKILIGTGVATLFSIIRTFMIIQHLNPETYGVWNIFTILLSYSLWCELGVVSGMDKLVPFFRGQSNNEEAVQTRNVAFTSLIIIYTILGGGIIFAASIPVYPFPQEILTGLKLLAMVVFFSALQNFYLTVARAEKKFGIISITSGLFAISVVAILFFLYPIMRNELHATLLSFILAYSLSLLFCMLFSGLVFRFKLSLARLRNIIPIGLPLVFIGIGYILFTSIDRWMIAKFMTKMDLGHYAFSYTVGILFYSLAAVVAYVYYPRMLEKLGEGFDHAYFRPHVYKALLIMSYVIAFSASVLMIALPTLCPLFFPLYVPTIEMTEIMIIGFFFISIATITGNFLVAANKQNTILILQIVGIGVLAVADYIIIKLTGDVLGVAVVTAFFLSLYGIAIIFFSFTHMQCTTLEAARIIMNLAVPLTAAVVLLLIFKTANATAFVWHSHLVIIPEMALALLVYVGLFILQGRENGILAEVRNFPGIRMFYRK